MSLYCINHVKKGNTAGSKAPADCFEIATRLGAKEIVFRHSRICNNIYVTRFLAFFASLKNWINLLFLVSADSWVIIQHPYEGIEIARVFIPLTQVFKNIKYIAIIHDLESLRCIGSNGGKYLSGRNYIADSVLLRKCDCIIAHNPSMKEYLTNNGFTAEKVYSLGVFDYICEENDRPRVSKDDGIIVAGNLASEKCPYLYELIGMNGLSVPMHLYGPNYGGSDTVGTVDYHGQFSPQELVNNLQGAFGLVWDGTSLDTCAGNTGEYLRYNNPHKLSMFLASNIPVIIWSEAALAGFVRDNGVGICIDSLLEIESTIALLSEADYSAMLEKVLLLGEKVRNGEFLKKALEQIITDQGIEI